MGILSQLAAEWRRMGTLARLATLLGMAWVPALMPFPPYLFLPKPPLPTEVAAVYWVALIAAACATGLAGLLGAADRRVVRPPRPC